MTDVAELDHQALLKREQEFHDQRYADGEGTRTAQLKYYWAVPEPDVRFFDTVAALSQGRDILELGCGYGHTIFRSPFRSAAGIDISEASVAEGNRVASSKNVPVTLKVGDAQATGYPDGSFDFVFGSGILHHVDAEACVREVHRLLKPGGHAFFYEPLAHNPLINAYRAMTPKARTDDEHPFTRDQVVAMTRHFAKSELKFFGLAALGSAFVYRLKPLHFVRPLLGAVDRVLLSIPGVRWGAWQVQITLRK